MKYLSRDFPSSIRPYSIDILLIVFLFAYSFVGMWNFGINMATLHEDDGPIFYAYAFKDPSLFEGDYPIGFPLSILLPFKVMTSGMVWIPAMSWKYFDLDPFMMTGVLTLFQGVLLGLSIYIFSLAVIQKKAVAFIATIFAYSAAPWTWAPAGYGNISTWTFLPYAATLATSPILLAFACVLKKRELMAFFLLAFAGLIHPGITLHAAIIMGMFFLIRGMKEYSRALVMRQLAGLAFVVIVTILPSLWMQATINFEALDTVETMAGMRHNQHVWPWGFQGRWYPGIATMLTWTLFALVSLRWKNDWTSGTLTLCLSAFVGACIMGLTQIVGGIFENLTLLNFVGLRSFMWFTLIALPLIVNYWHAHLRYNTFIGIVSVLICLTVPFWVREYPALRFSPLIFAFLYLDMREGYLSLWRFSPENKRNMILILIAVLAFFLGILAVSSFYDIFNEKSAHLHKTISRYIWPFGGIRLWQFVIFVSVAAILGLFFQKILSSAQTRQASASQEYQEAQVSPGGIKFHATTLTVLMISYSLLFLMMEVQTTVKQSKGEDRSLMDAQIWARQNTPSSSVFVFPSRGWRTMSQRRKFDPFTRESYAYVAPRQAKEHRDRLLRFYGISEKDGKRLRGTGPNGVHAMQRERFFNYSENDFLRFASEFGTTHLVLPVQGPVTKATTLSLPVAFQNSHYVIYKLSAQIAKK